MFQTGIKRSQFQSMLRRQASQIVTTRQNNLTLADLMSSFFPIASLRECA
jgi:hypothetical protein